MTYEAGAAFGFQVHASSDLPLAWFAVFDAEPLRLDNLSQWCRSDPDRYMRNLSRMTPTLTADEFEEAFDRIKAHIAERRHLSGELHISPRRNVFGRSAAALRRPRPALKTDGIRRSSEWATS